MKIKFSAPLILLVALTGVSGCSDKTPSLDSIDLIVSPTDTKFSDRNDIWYSKQENIRNSVLSACFTHFSEEAQISGGQILYDFYENPYGLFNAIPDCMNARKGEVITLGQLAQTQDEVEINSIQNQLQSDEQATHINEEALKVAKRLEALQAERKDETSSTLNLIYDTTKEGSELEKTLKDANLIQ